MYKHIEKDEKKLTDEEIVKALECCANFSTQKDCDLCPIGVIKCFEQENLVPQLALDLINRQKAEIERLTEENKQLEEEIDLEVDLQTQRKRQIIAESQEFIDELANKNAELQKQVDELTAEKEDLYFQNQNLQTYIDNHEPIWKRNTEQAVKDTAKEIFEKLLGYMGSQQQFCIVDEEHKTLIDCDKLFDFVGNLAKEKGVEVE